MLPLSVYILKPLDKPLKGQLFIPVLRSVLGRHDGYIRWMVNTNAVAMAISMLTAAPPSTEIIDSADLFQRLQIRGEFRISVFPFIIHRCHQHNKKRSVSEIKACCTEAIGHPYHPFDSIASELLKSIMHYRARGVAWAECNRYQPVQTFYPIKVRK